MKIAVIDNYDSFTYNLVHYLENLDVEVSVFRNDEFDLEELEPFNKILLSPGPGIPDEAGLLKAVIKHYGRKKSILGVCLGLQAIGEVYGGQLINLTQVFHGVATAVKQTNTDYLFDDLPEEMTVGRYHSWVIAKENLPKDLIITSVDETGQIMSLKHLHDDVRGVQYHPESVLTPHGQKIIENWVNFKR
jgi:anthranilate synthase component 2